MPSLSVVIPTHKRASILKQCIDHLEKQTIRSDLEVIVVSDGDDPPTAALFHRPKWNLNLRFLEIGKSHQGVARNEGVKEANGKYVLFIGDDIFLDAECCAKHLLAHESCETRATSDETSTRSSQLEARRYAVLGFTTWDPACGITPVMKWLESSGWQFGYPEISRYAHQFLPADMQHRFSYTSNISVPLDIARAHPFLNNVHLYGWEDVEWGKRKKKSGVRILYEPDAKALHHHHIELEDSLKRMEILGTSLVHLESIVPDLNMRPMGLKLLGYKLTAMLPTMAGKHRRAFLRGLGLA